MSKHGEPWKVQHPHSGPRGFEIADHTGRNQICQDVSEKKANRIVACVNACAGIPTKTLQRYSAALRGTK